MPIECSGERPCGREELVLGIEYLYLRLLKNLDYLCFLFMFSVYFLFFKKEKKLFKNGVTEGQQKVGLRCLGGLSGHFDNMASPLPCLIVMFNGHPCSLR